MIENQVDVSRSAKSLNHKNIVNFSDSVIKNIELTSSEAAFYLFGADLEHLKIIRICESSAEPYLFEGDHVFVDTRKRQHDSDGFYAARVNGNIIVRYIKVMEDGSIVVKNIDGHFDDERYSAEEIKSIEIIGKLTGKKVGQMHQMF
jgi:hypothetical protein